jgi:hypothetical protein
MIVALKMWQSSNTWKRHYQTEMVFMKELREELFGEMLLTIISQSFVFSFDV